LTKETERLFVVISYW